MTMELLKPWWRFRPVDQSIPAKYSRPPDRWVDWFECSTGRSICRHIGEG